MTFPPALASFFGTLAVVLISRILTVRMKCPITIFLISGIIPLVPGAGVYFTAYYLVTEPDGPGRSAGNGGFEDRFCHCAGHCSDRIQSQENSSRSATGARERLLREGERLESGNHLWYNKSNHREFQRGGMDMLERTLLQMLKESKYTTVLSGYDNAAGERIPGDPGRK